MGKYSHHNAQEVLNNVEKRIADGRKLRISSVCEELSIFDWWHEFLSVSQLKQMRSFLNQSIKLGFTGYVCFKVGAAGCGHGMWSHKEESTDGYSPNGDCLYHSFRSGDNYWGGKIGGVWTENLIKGKEIYEIKLADLKAVM